MCCSEVSISPLFRWPNLLNHYTPNWIVKYLVQNSVGRQWLQTYPDSAIKTQMEYYIEPAEQSDEVNQQLKAITPESIEPETIKVLDPACGSGHILIEAYNVLKAIYEERGFRSRDIPKMILENNLYGLDIDDRAAQLSGFALMMMARDDDKRIFTRNVRLNVLSLQESNHIDLPTLWKALNLSGSWQSGTSQGLFSDDNQDLSSFNADNRYQLLKRTLARFTQAKTFGSLIDVPSDEHEQLKELLSTLVELQESGDSMQKPAAKQLIEIVHQALVLSIRYDAVIANPPYMGSKGMNADLKDFTKTQYPNSKSDLFAIFMERAFTLLFRNGYNAQVNMQSWMFLSSYEQLRSSLLEEQTFITMAHLGPRAFSQISGEVVQTTAWVIKNNHVEKYQPIFFRLVDGNEEEKRKALLNRENKYSSSVQSDFKKIPCSPIAYWVSEKFKKIYENDSVSSVTISDGQNKTGNNDVYLRCHWEVNSNDVGIDRKWLFYAKGGGFRRWYGNLVEVIDWSEGARLHYRRDKICRIIPDYLWYEPGITWGLITSSKPTFRTLPDFATFDVGGSSIFFKNHDDIDFFLALFNSTVALKALLISNPTLNFQVKNIRDLPIMAAKSRADLISLSKEAQSISKIDWDSKETAFEFSGFPGISEIIEKRKCGLIASYMKEIELRGNRLVERLKFIEEKINLVIASEYELVDEIDCSVSNEEVSLNCNPSYIGISLASGYDSMRAIVLPELISYCIGCQMGRFTLNSVVKDNSDELQNVDPYSVDDDGIIPLTDQEWFRDDATNRFREFVQVVWGDDHLQENLDFVAESLCLNAIKPKKSELALETIRRYLSTQFYKDHLKTYKKRPIYWLFSSGKQKAFECLVYLHRYNEGTLSRMRTEYVTPLLGKYDAYAEQLEKQIETADSTSEANRFKKELDALIKKQVELREFDDKLKHYADMRISLDLDDGVKVNYGKFGDLLADVKAITGSAPEVN
ncbi:BREX-1 system adenine-specific DNA-methyltransferase PglX [Providencia rettgeri]